MLLLGFDWMYVVVLMFGFALSAGTSVMVFARFSDARAVTLKIGKSGAEIARDILRAHSITDVVVVEYEGFLSDHYHLADKKLALSPEVFRGRDAAAAGVAAHEAGHAMQAAHGSVSLRFRSVLSYPAMVGFSMAESMVILGLAMAGFKPVVPGTIGYYFALIGALLFGACLLYALAMVANELDASSRAREQLVQLNLTQTDEERAHVDRVLHAAAMTYVAAAVFSAIEMAYWVLRAFAAREED
jgi:Zn-dependent membrane protease YugP